MQAIPDRGDGQRLLAMRGYSLTGAKMKEIQATNAKRSAAVAEGMTIRQAMEKYPCTQD